MKEKALILSRVMTVPGLLFFGMITTFDASAKWVATFAALFCVVKLCGDLVLWKREGRLSAEHKREVTALTNTVREKHEVIGALLSSCTMMDCCLHETTTDDGDTTQRYHFPADFRRGHGERAGPQSFVEFCRRVREMHYAWILHIATDIDITAVHSHLHRPEIRSLLAKVATSPDFAERLRHHSSPSVQHLYQLCLEERAGVQIIDAEIEDTSASN